MVVIICVTYYQSYISCEPALIKAGIYQYSNVCIEQHHTSEMNDVNGSSVIVIYNPTARRHCRGIRRLNVAGSLNTLRNHWDVESRSSAVPQGHTVIHETAFFVVQTCPANLHHFFQDEFMPLFSVMHKLKRIEMSAGLSNHVLYRSPGELNSCSDLKRYEFFLQLLNVNMSHDVYYNTPPNTCFSRGVFGTNDLLPKQDARWPIDFIKAKQTKNISCVHNSSSLVIIQREYRNILNVDDLKGVAMSLTGYTTQVVAFHALSVQEQLAVASCSQVMVGVQGAGLQWAMFMNSGSTLIEIAWPEKHWDFYYRIFLEPYGINVVQFAVGGSDIHLNWKSHAVNERKGVETNEQEREGLMSQPPNSPESNNIWKWADVHVNLHRFRSVLRNIL